MHVLCSALLISVALSNPQGGTVVSGTATISTAGKTLTVNQATDKAIINWQRFENTATETIRFQQPATTSLALNRVIGVDPSSISGALQANGRIFLMNPNGIVFGPTARVNVGSIVASTLAISNDDFDNNNFRLVQTSGAELGAVVNQGTITAAPGGMVALVAPIVSNDGTIVAAAGRVFMVGTTDGTVTLDPGGNVVNNRSGLVDTGGRIPTIGLSTLLESVINTASIAPNLAPGRVERLSDGTVFLRGADGIVVNGGTIDVSGPTAGLVSLNGTNAVALGPGSLIAGGTGTAALKTVKGEIFHHRPDGASGAQAVVRAATINADAGPSRIRTTGNRLLKFEGGSITLRGRDAVGRLDNAIEISGERLNALADRGDLSLFVVGDIILDQARSNLRATGLDPSIIVKLESSGSIFAGTASGGIHFGGMRQLLNVAGDLGSATAAFSIATPSGGTQSITVGGTRFSPEFPLNQGFPLSNTRPADQNPSVDTALQTVPLARSTFTPPVDAPEPVVAPPPAPEPVLAPLPAVDSPLTEVAPDSSSSSTLGQADNVLLPALRTTTVREDGGGQGRDAGNSSGGLIEVVSNTAPVVELDGTTSSQGQVASSSRARDERVAQLRRRRQAAARRPAVR